MADIEVQRKSDETFEVTVRERGSQSSHTVTVRDDYHRKLTGGGVTPEDLVTRSFEFLLEREPKEAILGSFELPVISRYFPEYEKEIRRRIGQ